MASPRVWSILAGVVALGVAGAALAGEVCEPAPAGPVQLVILKTPAKVYELARAVAKGSPVVARDATTVVFQDGRVITSDVGKAGAHLERLGWNKRRVEIGATFAPARARPRRARG